MKILFVCTGNTCRSPMAEALMRHKHPDADVKSAGIFAGKNQRANQTAMEALKQMNIPIDHHSQPVTRKLLTWADAVLTMTTQHKQSLIMQYPVLQDKYYTLKEYVSENDRKVWQELKQAYADYEDKRAAFIQEYQYKWNQAELDRRLNEQMHPDLQLIQQMEKSLINYDISDPFGGELAVYQQTLQELDKYTDLLIKKIM